MHVLVSADPELPVPPRLYGGIERIVDALVRGLRARGHTVGLVAHAGSACSADAFFPWPGQRSQNPWDSARNALALAQAVRSFRPEVLHSFSRLLYMLPLAAPGASRVPLVMSYQRDPSRRTVAAAARLLGQRLTFTGCSEHIAATGRAAGGSWYAIPNFVDPDVFTFQPRVPDDAPLVFLSRVERIKGAHTAIEVARRTGRRLVIAGNHADNGEAGAYWRDEIEPHIGHDGIEYVGPVDDAQKDALLGAAAAMLVPIEWEEPFGIVFAEALACGTPVISTPRGSLPEIVRDGVDGFLARTVDDLCAAVGRLSEIDRSACRARAETTFSAPAVLTQYETLYRSVADASR